MNRTSRRRLLQVETSRTPSLMSWQITTTPFVKFYIFFSPVLSDIVVRFKGHMTTFASLTTSVIPLRRRMILRSLFSSHSRVCACACFQIMTQRTTISLAWKRVLLAEGPRQTINALTLWSIYLSKKKQGNWYDVPKYFVGNTLSVSALTVTTFFTVVVFIGSLLLLIIAGIGYIPLLCYIQGNLKVRSDKMSQPSLH
jgi:hypothetical protein